MYTEKLNQILYECVCLIVARGFTKSSIWATKDGYYTYRDLIAAVTWVQEGTFYKLEQHHIERLLKTADYISLSLPELLE